MRNKQLLLRGIVAAIAITAVAATFIVFRNAPETSAAQLSDISCIESADADDCIRFPTITGDNLLGNPVTYPADFRGQYVLTVVPFDQDQQVLADSWLPYVQDLAEQYPDFSYYNIPIFPDLETVYRLMARAGMIVLIEDAGLREITTTVFLENREVFLDALEIPDVEALQIMLMTAEGEVLWRESGAFSDDKGSILTQQLENLLTG